MVIVQYIIKFSINDLVKLAAELNLSDPLTERSPLASFRVFFLLRPSQMSSLLRHHSLRVRIPLHLFIAQTQTSVTRHTPLPSLLTTPRRAYASRKAKNGQQQKGKNRDETESTLLHTHASS